MKIIITCEEKNRHGQVDQRFGRCQYFAIYTQETDQIEFIENNGVNANQGAGISAAQKVVDLKADALLTGHIGPKAIEVLKAAKISGYEVTQGSIEEAIKDFNEKTLSKIEKASRG